MACRNLSVQVQNCFKAVNPTTVVENKNSRDISGMLFVCLTITILMIFHLTTPLTTKGRNNIIFTSDQYNFRNVQSVWDWSSPIGSEGRKLWPSPKKFSNRTSTTVGAKSPKMVEFVFGYSIGRTVGNWSFPIGSEDRRFRPSQEIFFDRTPTDFGRSRVKLPESAVVFTPI